MRTVPWVLGLASACEPGVARRYLVVDGREGEYALVEAEIPELRDAARMEGALGDGRVGGYLSGTVDGAVVRDVRYEGGGDVHLRYHVDHGLGIPHDDDGIVLWTYYHTLSRARFEFADLGLDVEPVFPVPFAYQPSLGGVLYTTTNAAYAGDGVHLFVLLADTLNADLPLASNPGIVRHEFGHALFQLWVAGAPQVSRPEQNTPAVRALNEGFADMVATLSLDDPAFIDASIVVPERRVDRDANVDDAASVAVDPYSRGTVYASLAWDLRERSDPDTALLVAVAALRRWAAAAPWTDGLEGVDRWAEVFVEEVASSVPEALPGMCDAHRRRFRGVPAVCR